MSETKPTLKLRGSDKQKLRDAAELVLSTGDKRTAEILLSLAFAVEHMMAPRPAASREPLPYLFDDETGINLEAHDEETVINLVRNVVPDSDPTVYEDDETIIARVPTPRDRPRTATGGHIRSLMVKEPSAPTRVGLGSGIRKPTLR